MRKKEAASSETTKQTMSEHSVWYSQDDYILLFCLPKTKKRTRDVNKCTYIAFIVKLAAPFRGELAKQK